MTQMKDTAKETSDAERCAAPEEHRTGSGITRGHARELLTRATTRAELSAQNYPRRKLV